MSKKNQFLFFLWLVLVPAVLVIINGSVFSNASWNVDHLNSISTFFLIMSFIGLIINIIISIKNKNWLSLILFVLLTLINSFLLLLGYIVSNWGF